MNTFTPQQFAAVCFLVLMHHHGGTYLEAQPAYIHEKLSLLNRGYNAYSALDRNNQEAVKRYSVRWHFELPEPVQRYERELLDAGIFN